MVAGQICCYGGFSTQLHKGRSHALLFLMLPISSNNKKPNVFLAPAKKLATLQQDHNSTALGWQKTFWRTKSQEFFWFSVNLIQTYRETYNFIVMLLDYLFNFSGDVYKLTPHLSSQIKTSLSLVTFNHALKTLLHILVILNAVICSHRSAFQFSSFGNRKRITFYVIDGEVKWGYR